MFFHFVFVVTLSTVTSGYSSGLNKNVIVSANAGYGSRGLVTSTSNTIGPSGILSTTSAYGIGNKARGTNSLRPAQVVQAAVHSRHNVEFYDVPSTSEPVKPTVVEVGSHSLPLQILFRSSSSSLDVQQAHEGTHGSVQETSSEDEPHRLVHSVKKPIIQEVYEVITPYRKITQEIHPVQEEIQTIVARGTGNIDETYDSTGLSTFDKSATLTSTYSGVGAKSRSSVFEDFKTTTIRENRNLGSQLKNSY